ncbi:hypothetical protein Sru01_18410 [Sphaerisporangium rufum]|uniref:Uncharacterized protein n=1 Tax=Sphaerisporangium rufum TaxID=1381558 RepID=A0A919UYJ0_9ACTN|nr:Imm8 family immunity protein [Sphaerisporangium rufum]GII76859.1 hypothetical protein Sru01_18410 [Sphaerisporangium rufum]
MKVEISDFHSPDIDWEDATPAEWKARRSVLVQVFAGPRGGKGAESFTLMACTPEYIAEMVREHGVVDGRHHLVMASLDRRLIERYLRRRIESLEAYDWSELTLKIGRFGLWEGEDYSD